MEIPDFSIPSKDCFLKKDKNGVLLKKGDFITSEGLLGFRSGKPESKHYGPVINYNEHLVIELAGSHLLRYFVEAHCILENQSK